LGTHDSKEEVMEYVPTGWGLKVPSAQHYSRTYKNPSELMDLTLRCVVAGLQHGEMVVYSVLPDNLTTFMERLEVAVPDLKQRVAAGQLQQKVNAQAVNAWEHGGLKAVRQLIFDLCNQAKTRGFRGVRWVGQAYLSSAEPTALMDWFGMQEALAASVRERQEIPVTTLFLYKSGGPSDLMASSFAIIDPAVPDTDR
jgi:hypothetical protein